MTDQQLLELAARAAGIEDHTWCGIGLREEKVLGVPHCGHQGPLWNPLKDDGDAFRLAVKLGLSVDCMNGSAGADELSWHQEIVELDLYANTRRAIVRAAAQIGEQMDAKA